MNKWVLFESKYFDKKYHFYYDYEVMCMEFTRFLSYLFYEFFTYRYIVVGLYQTILNYDYHGIIKF